jgi:sulfatase maturation enzyme AslB (radical SAM superfamily)
MPQKNNQQQVESYKEGFTLNLMVTQDCNLKCKYCYEGKSERSKQFMKIETMKQKISKYMALNKDHEYLLITLFGGEPLLDFPLIREVIEWVCSKKWNKKYFFLIATNGTILTTEMKEFFLKFKKCLSVGVSIDGCRKAHNIGRNNSYDAVMENIDYYNKYFIPTQPVKMTVYKDTLPYLEESIIHLENLAINFTSNVVFEDTWGEGDEKQRLLEIYEDQLDKIVKFYSENLELYPPTPMLTAVPEYLANPKYVEEKLAEEEVRFCGAGKFMRAIDVDGEEYGCHRLVPWITGRDQAPPKANKQKKWLPKICSKCKYVLSCPTCIGFNWEINGNCAHRTTFHCESYKLEMMASCKLEAIRLAELNTADFDKIPEKELKRNKTKLKAILNFIEEIT